MADLQRDLLLGHGSLHRLVHLRVLNAKAAEDGESFQELFVVSIEGLDAARRFVHLIHQLTDSCEDKHRHTVYYILPQLLLNQFLSSPCSMLQHFKELSLKQRTLI